MDKSDVLKDSMAWEKLVVNIRSVVFYPVYLYQVIINIKAIAIKEYYAES